MALSSKGDSSVRFERFNHAVFSILDSMQPRIMSIDSSNHLNYLNFSAQKWFRDLSLIANDELITSSGLLSQSFLDIVLPLSDKTLFTDTIDAVRSHCVVAKDLRITLDGCTALKNENTYTDENVSNDLNSFDVDIFPIVHGNSCGEIVISISDVVAEGKRKSTLVESDFIREVVLEHRHEALWRYDLVPPVDVNLSVEDQVRDIIYSATLVQCNEVMAAMFGRKDVDSVIGTPIYSNGSMSNKRDTRAFIENGYRSENVCFARISKNGKLRNMEFSARGVIEEGILTHVWGFTRDTT